MGGVRDAGCDAVIVHARKAVLGGLSAQDNREIPPLQYEVVRARKARLSRFAGGRQWRPARAGRDCQGARGVDGIMLGREAYHRPVVLARLDALVFGTEPNPEDAHPASRERSMPLCARAP